MDDDRSVRALLAEVAAEVTSDVEAAADLPEVSAADAYDLALVDLVPLLRYETRAARRFVDAARHLARRVVVVTVHSGASADGAAALGADLVLAKPFDIEEVLAAIEPG